MQPFYQEGRYRAEVINQALGKNNKGTPQFVLKVHIASMLVDGEETRVQQYDRTIYMYLTEKSAEYTLDKLKGIGFEGTSIRQLDPNHQGCHSFIGMQIELDCKHEEDQNGDLREKWDLAFNGSNDIEITPLDAAEARKLDALFGKSLGGTKPAPAKKTATRQPVPVAVADTSNYNNPEIDDDSIPF